MALDPDLIRRTLRESGRPLGVQDLMRRAGIHPGQQTAVKRLLRDLVHNGELAREGKRFAPAHAPRHPGPEAFVPAREGRSRRAGNAERPARGERTFAETARPGRGERFAHDRAPVRTGRHERGAQERMHGRGRPKRRGGRIVEGTLQIRRDGHGFVRTPQGEEFFVPEFEARQALENDKVRLEVFEGGPRVEAHIVQIAARHREQAVGTYLERPGGAAVVIPRDATLPGPIRVPRTQIARSGDVVRVVLGIGRELLGGEGLTGEVAGSLGQPGHPSQEVLSIAFAQGFSDEFPGEVMAEADAIPTRVPASAISETGRRDLRSLPLITIDGEDARDFDDAVYAEPHGAGFKLWVAIADVSQYVREGTGLDAEALRRATSVYLPDRVLPMLPERLSNGLCSLRPDEDRLCLVAEIDFDAKGRRHRFELYPGVMRSAARCTYTEVQAVLEGGDVPHRNAFRPQYRTLQALARSLHRMRLQRGAIDFDLPEIRVEMGQDGEPARMVKRERLESHRIVEECMLAANEAVASFFQRQGLPTVYRFHGEPDPDKIATFIELANSFGFKLGHEDEVTSKELNDFIQKLAGHPEQRALNQLLLRSMMQAVYSSENVGHYGLAAEEYLHFTSPIRRYPDLLVHRLLKAHWARGARQPSGHELESQEHKLERMAMQSSERERAAMLVEREVVSFYATLLVKDRIGEVFRATVASVTDFGFFVQLEDLWVEGLVKAESVGFGARYDERRLALRYPDGRAIKVGQKVAVRLTSVNVGRRQIDFELESLDAEAAEPARVAEREARAGGRSKLLDRIDQLKRERAQGGRAGSRAPRGAPVPYDQREPSELRGPRRKGGKVARGAGPGRKTRGPSPKRGGKKGPRGRGRR